MCSIAAATAKWSWWRFPERWSDSAAGYFSGRFSRAPISACAGARCRVAQHSHCERRAQPGRSPRGFFGRLRGSRVAAPGTHERREAFSSIGVPRDRFWSPGWRRIPLWAVRTCAVLVKVRTAGLRGMRFPAAKSDRPRGNGGRPICTKSQQHQDFGCMQSPALGMDGKTPARLRFYELGHFCLQGRQRAGGLHAHGEGR